MVSVACARPAGKDSTAIWRPLARLPRTALCAGRTRALVRRIARLDFLAWKSRFQVVQVFRAATSQFFKISSVQVSPRAHDGSPSFRVRTRLRTGFAANPPRRRRAGLRCRVCGVGSAVSQPTTSPTVKNSVGFPSTKTSSTLERAEASPSSSNRLAAAN